VVRCTPHSGSGRWRERCCNSIGGFAGLLGFGILFIGRVAREEGMMLETFGGDYRAYMARTYRVIPGIY
jgi:protein-S-isoprenylcysteine O-methyltransferase Ste14